jgi:K+-sensing histidine kinase KdpD
MGTAWFRQHRPFLIVLAAGLPLAWCSVAAQLRGDVTSATAALVLVAVVVGAATTGDRLAGVVAAASGGLWFDYFLTEPFHRFTIEDSDDIEVTLLLVLVGICVTELALWGGRQQAKASSRAGYLDGVLTTSRIVSGQFSPTALSDQVAAQITELLDVDSCRFAAGSTLPRHSALLGPDGDVTTTRGAQVNVDRDGMPALEETALPAQHHGVVYGHFMITAATDVVRPTLEQRRVAVLLANQVGAALAPSSLGPHPR